MGWPGRNLMTSGQLQFKGKTLVVGLGLTGMSVVRFLAARGESIAVTDSRDIPPGLDTLKTDFPDVARFTGGFDKKAFLSADRLIVSPGISLDEPLIKESIERGIPVIGDIELFAQYVDAPVVAITGSNGKTTVTTLLGEMARASGRNVGVGGNIGTPALELLNARHDLYVLELSSFQLETLSSLQPVAATILNISADHMDRYDSLDDYALAKARIYSGAQQLVVNLDDAVVTALAGQKNIVGFSLQLPVNASDFGVCQRDAEQWLCQGEKPLCLVSSLLMAGEHNIANALAALALGSIAGLRVDKMLAALTSFTGLPHRTQFVTQIDGVKFYNDSKATNVGACMAALLGLDKHDNSKAILILGGECKDADFSGLTDVIEKTCRAVILIGRDAKQIKLHLPTDMQCVMAGNFADVVEQARLLARPGDRVLLSPACASFDMFKNYEERGEQFIDAVRRVMQ